MVERPSPDWIPVTGGGVVQGARLCNFVTSEAFLLRSHEQKLDEFLAFMRAHPGYWIEIVGYASRAGDRGYNQGLSERRAKAVRSYLEQGVNRLNITVFTAFGEDESGGGERNNDGFWRAVTVRIFVNKPPPPAPPAKPKYQQNFAVRILSMASLSVPFVKIGQLDMLMFQIVDIERKQSATFQYTGGAFAPPSPFAISPVSFSNQGPWKVFKLLRNDLQQDEAVLTDFGDRAKVTQGPGAQIGNQSVGVIFLSFVSNKLWSKRTMPVDDPLIVQGGSGFALPAAGSMGLGQLKQVGDIEYWPHAVVDGM